MKGKRERERYTQLNAEFQRMARRNKKAFFNEQCKEMEKNNRVGKTRDLFKKIGDIKRMFHARTGLIKDRNGENLTEAEEIKKTCQEYIRTKQKIFMTQITMMVGSLTWSQTSWSVKSTGKHHYEQS